MSKITFLVIVYAPCLNKTTIKTNKKQMNSSVDTFFWITPYLAIYFFSLFCRSITSFSVIIILRLFTRFPLFCIYFNFLFIYFNFFLFNDWFISCFIIYLLFANQYFHILSIFSISHNILKTYSRQQTRT